MNDALRLLWTQAWQIAVLAFVVAIVTRTVAKNRPHLAHAMWLLVLIKCVTPPIWGHSLGLFSRLQAAISTEQFPAASNATYENIPQAAEPTSSLVRPSLESEFHIPGSSASDLTTTQGLPTAESSPATVPAIDLSEVTATKSVEGVRELSYSWPAILLFCLAAGAFVTLSLMIARCVQCLRSIHRHRTTEFDDLLMERVQDLSHKLRLRRAPRVIVSDVLFGPAVLGLLRHTIVLPRCLLQSSRCCLPGRTGLSRSFLPERTFAEGEPARRTMDNAGLPEGTECTQVAASREVLPGREDLPELLPGRQDLLFLDPILAHELLHIRRGDLRTGLLQAIVQSLWWFHPAVWFSTRWLSREAERCCDEQVIAELCCSPAQYARSLLSVIESKHQLQPVPVFPGMKPVEITTQRMERIMSLKTGLKKQTPLWCWLAVAVLAIVVLPGALARPTTAEPKPADEEKQPTNVNTVDDCADAIRLDSEFDLSGDLKPETVLAFVNNKPIKVSDVVPNPFAAGGWSRGYGKSRPMDIQAALRDRLPEVLYEELVVQHYETTVAAERQAKALESLEKYFRQMLEVIKAQEKITTDEQLRARLAKDGTSLEMFQQSFLRDWLVPRHEQASHIPSPLRDSSDEQLAAILEEDGISIEKLRYSYVRRAIAREHARGLPTNSPLRNKEEIIKKCSTLIDKCSGITVFEPVLEIRLDDDFALSPDMSISGSTVIAYINDQPITLERFDGYMWNKLMKTDGLSDPLKRLTVLESIAYGLPEFVYQELVFQHINENPPEDAFDKSQNDGETKNQKSGEIQANLARKNHQVSEKAFAKYVADLSEVPADSRKEARYLASLLKSGSFLNNQPRIQEVNGDVQKQHHQSAATGKPAVIRYVEELVTTARLRTVVSFNLENATLEEAVSALSDALGISIEIRSLDFKIGSRVFGKAGLISFQCSNIPLSEAIDNVFHPYGMKLHLDGESVLLAFTDSQKSMDRFRSLPGPPAYGIFGIGVNDGWKVLEKEVRLLDAIVQFGGIPPADDATISITNPETVAGKAIPVSMSLRVLQKNSSGKLNRILRDGDIVTVSRKDSVNVRPGRTARAASEEEAVKDPEQLRSGSASVEGQSRDPVGAKRVPSLPEKSEFSDVAEKWFKDDAWVQNANGRFKHDGILLFFNQHEVVGDGHSIRIKPLAMICSQEKDGAPITITADSALLETSTKVSGESGHLAKIVSGTLEGNVRITSSDGMRIEGRKFQISEGAINVSTSEPVTFSWNKSTGEAEGGAAVSLRPSTDTAGIKLPDGHRIGNIRLHGPATINGLSTSLDVEAGKTKPANPPVIMVYSVADLVRPITKTKVTPSDAGAAEPFRAPASTKQDLADYSSLVELIKASVEPESWDTGPGAATIAENRDVLGLVIRQSKEAHEAIAKLLSQLRKSQDSVQITCRLLKIATDVQLKGLEEKCSLHSLSDGQRWALLTKSRSEELQKFLTDENTEVLSCPKIVTISGQAAFIEVGSKDQSKFQGFRLSANPRLIADSSVIRLSHSVTVGELAKDAQAAVHESLVGSGQTLLLVIEQPGKVDGPPDRYVVMLTPEHVKEEEETLPH